MGNNLPGLTGKVALITGGSRGIGRAAVDLFAENGTDVVVNYVHDREAAESAKGHGCARKSDGWGGQRAFNIESDRDN